MRTSKTDGRLRFQPEDHLTTAQVKSYFSKLTNIRRQQTQPTMNVTPDHITEIRPMDNVEVDDGEQYDENNDDFDSLLQESQRQELRLEINLMLGKNSLWDEEKK